MRSWQGGVENRTECQVPLSADGEKGGGPKFLFGAEERWAEGWHFRVKRGRLVLTALLTVRPEVSVFSFPAPRRPIQRSRSFPIVSKNAALRQTRRPLLPGCPSRALQRWARLAKKKALTVRVEKTPGRQTFESWPLATSRLEGRQASSKDTAGGALILAPAQETVKKRRRGELPGSSPSPLETSKQLLWAPPHV